MEKITSPVALARKPELVFLLAGAKTGRVFLENEGGDAVLRGGAVGHRHADANIGVVRVGGERLRAVEHPAIAVANRGGARAGRVRSGFGLGERPAADPFARRQFRQIFLLLLFRAGLVNVIGAERSVGGDDDADRAIHARKFFDDDGVFDVAQARAAVLFRERWRPCSRAARAS